MRSRTLIALFATICPLGVCGQIPGRLGALQPPTRSVNLANALFYRLGYSAPRLSGGLFVAHELSPSSSPQVAISHLDGTIANQVVHSYPGSSSTRLIASSVSSNGRVFSSGIAILPGSKKVFFLGSSDVDGSSQVFFSTGSYLAESVYAATDGTVWTVGLRPGTSFTNPQYGAVRHYSSAGTLLFQGRHTVGSGEEIRDAVTAPEKIRLAFTVSAVFVYDGTVNKLIKIDPSRKTIQITSFDTNNLRGRELTGFAITDDGSAYASFRKAHGSPVAGEIDYSAGLFRLVSSGNSSAWTPIEGTVTWQQHPNDFVRLMGSSGSELIYTEVSETRKSIRLVQAHP